MHLLSCLCRRVATERIWPIWQLCSFADCWKRPYRLPLDTWVPDLYRYRRNTRLRKVDPWSLLVRRLSTAVVHHRRTPSSVDPTASTRPARNPRRSIATVEFAPACLWSLANSRTDITSPRLECTRRSAVARTLRPVDKGNTRINNNNINNNITNINIQ